MSPTFKIMCNFSPHPMHNHEIVDNVDWILIKYHSMDKSLLLANQINHIFYYPFKITLYIFHMCKSKLNFTLFISSKSLFIDHYCGICHWARCK
jgi:hypothetical protein